MYHIALSVADADFRSVLNLLKSYCGRSLQARPGIIAGVFDDGRVAWLIRREFADSRIGISRYQGIAMGLAAIAKPGEILVDQDTISPLMEYFEFASLGLMNIEGMRAQLMVYRAESLLKPIEITKKRTIHFPYIRREREEKLLKDALTVADFVQVIGRDGIGKTSFLKNFVSELNWDVHFIPIWNYPPAIPFAPIETLIRSLLGIKKGISIGEAQTILHRRLEELKVRDFVSSYYSFLEFLKIGEEETLIAKLNLPKRYEMLKNAIIELIIKTHYQNQLLIVFDDLQFADGSTLELLKQILIEIKGLGIKLIYTGEYPIDLGQRTENVELGLLNPSAQQELIGIFGVEGIEPGPALPLQLKLYLTLVDAERDRALYQEFQGKSGIHSTPFKEIDWLVARWLENLTESSRELLYRASVIGTSFGEAEIRYLLPKSDPAPAFLELINSGMITANDGYSFQHRLIREEVYKAVPDRNRIHEELSEYYKKRSDPIRTVFHLIQADKKEEAVKLYLDAARVALDKGAWRTALDYYSEAKDIIRRLIEAKKDVDLEIIISIDERIGDVYRELGDEEMALKYYKSVLDSYREILKE